MPPLEKGLEEAGIKLVQEGLTQKWRPSPAGREQAVAFGARVLESLQADS